MSRLKTKIQFKKKDITLSLGIVGGMWVFFVLQNLGFFKSCYGIIPYHVDTLKGIVFSVVMHGSLSHLVSNSIALFILLLLLFAFYRKIALKVVVLGWLLSGSLLWLWPSFLQEATYCHIGASGVVYMLVSFLFFAGLFSFKFYSVILSLFIGLLYFSLVFTTSSPSESMAISWQGHLCGAISGLLLARFFIKISRNK